MIFYVPQSRAEHDQIARWVSAQIRGNPRFGPNAVCLAVIDGDRMLAGAVYTDLVLDADGAPADLKISFAASDPRWATRGNIARFLGYPFLDPPDGVGVRRLTMLAHIKNRRIRKLVEGLGFVHEGTHHEMFGRHKGVSYGMTRRAFLDSRWHRWLERQTPRPPETEIPLSAIKAA